MNWKFLSKESNLFFFGVLFFCSLKMQASYPLPTEQEKMQNLERVVRQSVGFMNIGQPFYMPTILSSSDLSADDYNRQSTNISKAMTDAGFEPTKAGSFAQYCSSSCVAAIIACSTPCAPKTAAQIRYNYLLSSAQSVIAKYQTSDRGFGGYVPLDSNGF